MNRGGIHTVDYEPSSTALTTHDSASANTTISTTARGDRAPAGSQHHKQNGSRFRHRAGFAATARGCLAEMGRPLVVLSRADRAACWIVRQRIGRTFVGAEGDIVCGIDRATIVVVAYELRFHRVRSAGHAGPSRAEAHL